MASGNLKYFRLVTRALEQQYPGLRFEIQHGRDHPWLLCDGKKLTPISTSPRTPEHAVRAVLRDARRLLGLPKGAP